MKCVVLAFCLLLSPAAAPVSAQGVTGTWKRTAMRLTEANGKTEDLLTGLVAAIPCMSSVTYTFLADGNMRVNVPESCGSMRKTIEQMDQAGRWSAGGGKLRIMMPDKSIPDSNYDLSLRGDTMTWSFDYAANPRMPNPTKARRLVITYRRL